MELGRVTPLARAGKLYGTTRLAPRLPDAASDGMDPVYGLERRLRVDLVMGGLVQGVGYRDRVRRAAGRLGVTGTVRNESDGTVVVVAEGSRATLEEFERAISGPQGASDARALHRRAPTPIERAHVRFDVII